jgi:hypothetical protein
MNDIPLSPPPGWSPYSRKCWTEHQQQFRPPRDGASVSTRLSDYATAEEIDAVITALQQVWRDLNAQVREAKQATVKRMSKEAVADNALAALWAATDRRRIGRMLKYLREGVVHPDYHDRAALLPEGPARALLLQFYARYEAAQAAAVDRLRREWIPPPVDDAAWEDHLRWLAMRGVRFSREWLLPHEGRLSSARQHQLIRERQNRFLNTHPELLETARRKAEQADGSQRGG